MPRDQLAIRTQRLLLQDQENCVDQFNVFGDVVELHLLSGALAKWDT